MRHRSHALILAGLLAGCTTSCAWIFQTGPSGPRGGACDESPGSPYVDVAFAGLSIASAAIYGTTNDPILKDLSTVGIVSGIAWALIHTASSIWGFNAASKCRDARAGRGPAAHRPNFVPLPPSASGVERAPAAGLSSPAAPPATVAFGNCALFLYGAGGPSREAAREAAAVANVRYRSGRGTLRQSAPDALPCPRELPQKSPGTGVFETDGAFYLIARAR